MPSRPSLPGWPAPPQATNNPDTTTSPTTSRHPSTPCAKDPRPVSPTRINPARKQTPPNNTPTKTRRLHPPQHPGTPHNNRTGTNANASRTASPEPTPTTTPNQTCDDQHEGEAGHPAFGEHGPADLRQEEENGRTTNQQNQKTKASAKTHPTIRLSTIERDASNTQRNVFLKQHAQKRSSRLPCKYSLVKELN